ncbi:MAG TPA: methyltransferase [Desulfuromonadaceae bacterium]
MELPTGFLQSRRLSLYSGTVLAIAFGAFGYTHLIGYQRSNDWMLLVFCFSEMLTAVFLVFRSAPETVSVDNFDWIIGIGGTFAPLLFRPSSFGLAPFAKYAIVAGVMIQIAGLVSLNRSLAIVAAKREIKTKGLYRFVRHPLYASYFLTFTGYVLMNTSMQNLIIYVTTMGLLFVRVFREEKHLALDTLYREYMQKVNYRVIPFVF